MKFKTIFAVFNFIIVFSFLLIFFMPLLLLGGAHFSDFFAGNWYIAVLFAATLIIFNGYFLYNWRLFRLLEKENWPELIGYLEERIFERNRINKTYVKLLINSYMVTANPEAILKLKNHSETRKPKYVRRFAVSFGLPYLLLDRPQEAESFYGKMLSEKRVKERDWVRWNYGFSLLQLKQVDSIKKALVANFDKTKDPIVTLLSAYMINSLGPLNPGEQINVQKEMNRFKARYTKEKWDRRVERQSGTLDVLVFGGLIKEAGDWAFGVEAGPEAKDIH